MQRPLRARQPTRFPHRQPRSRHPALPFDRREGTRRRAMPRQPRRNRDKAALLIILRQIAHAVGRVAQPVQQHHRPPNVSFRHQNKRTIPVGIEARWINCAAGIKAVQRVFIFLAQRIVQLCFHLLKDARFPLLILGKAGAIYLIG